MVRVELAPQVAEDFDRIIAHLQQYESPHASDRILEILQAFDVLERNPLIGRPVAKGKRELIIGRSGAGYIALYQYVDLLETVYVLAIRSQREAGYSPK
jgi:plasmid stabilization system protein ParE